MLVPCVPRCIPGESCVGTTALSLEITKTPPERGFRPSGRRDSNSGPLVPQTSALTRLRHAPRSGHPSGHRYHIPPS
jgi:hypothetical protein